jgi:hypothetical protein
MSCTGPILHVRKDLAGLLKAGTPVRVLCRVPAMLSRGGPLTLPLVCDDAVLCQVVGMSTDRTVILDPVYLVETPFETDAAEVLAEIPIPLNVREPDDATIGVAAFEAALETVNREAANDPSGRIFRQPSICCNLTDQVCCGKQGPTRDEPLPNLRDAIRAEQDELIVLAARASGAVCDPEQRFVMRDDDQQATLANLLASQGKPEPAA